MPESRSRAGQVGAWLLAPLLASAAMAFQVALDVPRAPMLERVEKKPKRPRKSVAARTVEGTAKAPRPRSKRQLASLRKTWSDRPLEDEPVDQSFRRRHEGLLRSVVTRARAVVLDGARTPPMQIRPACHTVRCDLELCGPSPVILGIAELLPGVSLQGKPLWHELREVEPVHEPPDRQAGDDHVCRRWIVAFTRDGGDVTKLAFPGEDPGDELKAQRPAKHEAAAG